MRIVVFCCIIPRHYANISPPYYINPEIDYILFSDKVVEVAPWQTRVVERKLESSRREAVHYKLQTHKYLSEYDWLVWIDGNFRLKKDPVEIVDEVIAAGYTTAFGEHWLDCIYREAQVCIDFKKDFREIIEPQVVRYRAVRYPARNGLLASTFFVRDNKDPKTCEVFDLWDEECKKGSMRTQISGNYCFWKVGIEYLNWKIHWGKNAYYQR